METINNMTTAASKAIWGTKGEEPISGQTGNVGKGEPYDAGNMGEHVEDAYPDTANGNTNTKKGVPETTYSKPTDTKPVEDILETTDIKPIDTKPDTAGVVGESKTEDYKPTTETDSKPNINPAEVKDSSVIPEDSTKAQNDVRDPSNPSTDPESMKGRNDVDNTDGMDKNDNPVKIDGPGPKPIAQVANEHGGDAANVNKEPSSSGPGAVEEAPKENHDGDMGTIHLKSSGLKADGGDFDATKPGAGAEADRLLGEKGVKRDDHGGVTGEIPAGEEEHHHKEKRSLKDKIKAKLHKDKGSSA
ncbi:hypothetical protein B0H66DRAFT_630026 [Apodospora peruviana]|uniref:Uncharacterized protein n=1 Tax=Apodospora peruviana TaxID=516989 RepID=A0AAE0HVY3_9PEZI|nr:hypothetical protein B0H66DRAFT_630026 [Apodospora peruviana]